MAGLYLHIPFCEHKCLYCDFYSIESLSSMDRFIEAISAEIRACKGAGAGEQFDTVFFGGGTPSLLEPPVVGDLIGLLRETFTVDDGAEVTLETNPGTVDAAKLREFHTAGVNRLSIGVQSFHDDELKSLTRIHTSDEARACVRAARDAGFNNTSIDLIFALPGQTPEKWEHTLSEAIALDPVHISAYCLIYEEGTPLMRLVRSKQVSPLPADTEASFYRLTMERLSAAGFDQYEISNFAKPGYRCRHNLTYWEHRNYLGFGPSAHSFRGKERWWNVSNLSTYIDRILRGERPLAGEERLGAVELFEERVMLGLRTGSIDLDMIRTETGVDIRAASGGFISSIVKKELAVLDSAVLRLTPGGFMICDELSARILADCAGR